MLKSKGSASHAVSVTNAHTIKRNSPRLPRAPPAHPASISTAIAPVRASPAFSSTEVTTRSADTTGPAVNARDTAGVSAPRLFTRVATAISLAPSSGLQGTAIPDALLIPRISRRSRTGIQRTSGQLRTRPISDGNCSLAIYVKIPSQCHRPSERLQRGTPAENALQFALLGGNKCQNAHLRRRLHISIITKPLHGAFQGAVYRRRGRTQLGSSFLVRNEQSSGGPSSRRPEAREAASR